MTNAQAHYSNGPAMCAARARAPRVAISASARRVRNAPSLQRRRTPQRALLANVEPTIHPFAAYACTCTCHVVCMYVPWCSGHSRTVLARATAARVDAA